MGAFAHGYLARDCYREAGCWYAAAWHIGGVRQPGNAGGGSGGGCLPWVAGMSLLGSPSSPVSCDSLVSVVVCGAQPACHVSVENSGTLLQTF